MGSTTFESIFQNPAIELGCTRDGSALVFKLLNSSKTQWRCSLCAILRQRCETVPPL